MRPAAEIHAHWITRDGREGSVGDPAALFPYWSFTETAIATCALRLAEEGALDLDARAPGQAWTPAQLLGHTAGLPDYGGLEAYQRAVAADAEPWPRDALLGAALARGMLFAPGSGWSYSNIGYMLAREAIEAAAGRGFAEVFETTIRAPLGLDGAALATTRAEFARVLWPAARRYHPGWVYHGCLVGSARDAARLLRGLLAGAVLGPGARARMLRPRPVGGALPGRPWTACGYGLGLMIGDMGAAGPTIGHTGGGPFSVAAVYHFPDRPDPVTVACFAEGADAGVVEFEAARIARGL
ncbi:MAG: serine hydrolase [Rhodovulum sulfidophilum]|uniref:Serine hydrolase n=1 Tax=Rhodovulum sulfidophilum TaxID=35806 RepID=A0A2W5NBD2_RHOSU|nr:MAG: serine hydrolase [Rhodovulum sulfidophilum]